MSAKPFSFRINPDLRALLDSYAYKYQHTSMTDICNAALFQFLTADEKKQKKYLRRFVSRHLEDKENSEKIDE